MNASSVDAPRATEGARYFAWLYAPPEARASVAAIFMIEREIEASTRASIEHSVSHARLNWWREELTRLGQGEPRHPATVEILRRSQTLGVTSPHLTALVDNAHWDLACAAPLQSADIDQLATRWATTVFAATTQLAVPTESSASSDLREFALRAGCAVWHLEQLATFRTQVALGRLRVAMPELEAFGLTAEDALRTPAPPALLTALRGKLDTARDELHRTVVDLSPAQQAAARAALSWAKVAARLADRDGASLSLSDSWAAWRTARAASNGRARIH